MVEMVGSLDFFNSKATEGEQLRKNDIKNNCSKNIVRSFFPENISEVSAVLNNKIWSKKNEELESFKWVCPFPEHKWYSDLWEKLTNNPKAQKEMEENIGISSDGKIEMIKMKKKFSILTAEHNGINIFKWEYKDQNGKIGIEGVTYITGRIAEKLCVEQDKQLFNDRAEVEEFISYFPWKSTKEKIYSFVQLFCLEKAGYWHPNKKEWGSVGSVGFVYLSKVKNFLSMGYSDLWSDRACEVKWKRSNKKGDIANIDRFHDKFPSPYIAYEDC